MHIKQFVQNVTIKFAERERKMMRKIAIAVVFLMCIWMLSACNTMHGFGKDVERGGEAIQKSSGQ